MKISHKQRAEELVAIVVSSAYKSRDGQIVINENDGRMIALAQLHATLALVEEVSYQTSQTRPL